MTDIEIIDRWRREIAQSAIDSISLFVDTVELSVTPNGNILIKMKPPGVPKKGTLNRLGERLEGP